MAISLRLLALAVLVAGLLAVSVASAPVDAQTGLTVTDGGADNNFPEGISFHVSAESDSPIDNIRLRYKILPDGTAASGQPEFESRTSVEATFLLEGNNPPKIYLPPGTTIEYHWEVTDTAGNEASTETKQVFYDDSRFQWSKAEGDGVTIYYYSGSADDAQAMHAVATERLASMAQLLGTEIPFEVQVWTYDSVEDMRPALQARSATYESQIITAGVRVASSIVLVLGNVSFDTLRHELTHVVTALAGESAFGTLPAWLDEGTAVYGQEDPGGFRDAVERAFDRGNVLSVREISAYPGDPNKVELFYGEGWSIVSYLIDTYGAEKFAELFAAVKGGKRIGSALEATYGFDEDGLEDEWRDANGLPPRPTAEPAPDDVPGDSGDEQGQPDAQAPGEDDSGSSTLKLIGLVFLVLAAAGMVAGGGILLARRM